MKLVFSERVDDANGSRAALGLSLAIHIVSGRKRSTHTAKLGGERCVSVLVCLWFEIELIWWRFTATVKRTLPLIASPMQRRAMKAALN